MAKDNFGLLLAALVAIVAVVGLVILFNGNGNTGASIACPNGQMVHTCDTSGGQCATICVTTNGGQYLGAVGPIDTRYEQAQRELMIGQAHQYYQPAPAPVGRQYY